MEEGLAAGEVDCVFCFAFWPLFYEFICIEKSKGYDSLAPFDVGFIVPLLLLPKTLQYHIYYNPFSTFFQLTLFFPCEVGLHLNLESAHI